VRLLGNDFSDEKIVQKNLVSVLEKYESKISSLEETKDLSSISLIELVNTLQTQEQGRMMRGELSMQSALYVKAKKIRRRQQQAYIPGFSLVIMIQILVC